MLPIASSKEMPICTDKKNTNLEPPIGFEPGIPGLGIQH